MSEASSIVARVGREQAGRVGQEHEKLRIHQVGHQRGQAVVVPETDLLVGHRVVLVDDGHHPQIDQMAQGAAGMQILRAVDEVERRQQHLAGEDAVIVETLLPQTHQAVLADGRHRLEHRRVRRPLLAAAQRVPAGGDRTRGDHHDDVPTVSRRGDLAAEPLHRFRRDRARTRP